MTDKLSPEGGVGIRQSGEGGRLGREQGRQREQFMSRQAHAGWFQRLKGANNPGARCVRVGWGGPVNAGSRGHSNGRQGLAILFVF